jgi:hypothetical protein
VSRERPCGQHAARRRWSPRRPGIVDQPYLRARRSAHCNSPAPWPTGGSPVRSSSRAFRTPSPCWAPGNTADAPLTGPWHAPRQSPAPLCPARPTAAAYAGVWAQRVRASCGNGEEQYCLKGNTLTYGSADRDGSPTHSAYSAHIVVDQDFVLNIPGHRARRGGTAAVRGHHNLFAAGTPAPARRSPSPARRSPSPTWAASATSPSGSPARWAPRSPCSRSHRRSRTMGCAWAPTATSDPKTFEKLAGRHLQPHREHGQRSLDLDACLSLLGPGRHPGQRWRSLSFP